ncbi:MAG: hypothetical protein WD060_04915 [Pirellulales bacterium]
MPDEGLSWCVFDGERFLLRDAVAEGAATLVGQAIWDSARPVDALWSLCGELLDKFTAG